MDAKQKWEKMLRYMLADFKRKNPGDKRTDRQILESLMEYFHRGGLVKKGANGKWLLPEIDGEIYDLLN